MRYMEDKASRLEGMGTEYMLLQNGPTLKFWESYSAFANSGGGSIIVKFSGRFDSDIDETIDKVWSGLTDRSIVSANILMNSDILRTTDGFTVNVPFADKTLRPVYIYDSFKTGTFVRYEGKTVRSSIENTLSMIRDSNDICKTVSNSEFDSSVINFESVNVFRSMMCEEHIWKGLTNEEFLSMVSMIEVIGDRTKLTDAGMLLFSNHHIASSMFLGYRLRYLDEETKIDSEDGRWSGNIFDFYSLVSERIDVIFDHINDSLKEIVINALVHSDYFFGEGVFIEYSNNSFRIVNSGLFRSNQNLSINGKRDPRNPTIAKMFRMISPMNGLKDAISSLNESGYQLFINENYISGSVTIVVRSSTIPKIDISSVEERILNQVSVNSNITISELSESIGLSRRQVERYIAELKSKEILVREGSRRAGCWKII